MTPHLYLSLMPEALVASQLSPEEFGAYYAVGSERKTQGQAAYFEIDAAFRNPALPIEEAWQRCVPHADGSPKCSVHVVVYRVLQHVPLSALGRLYLVTKDGRTLGVERAVSIPDDEKGLRLYHEIAPLRPLVVSALGPKAFYAFFMGDPKKNIAVPTFCWVELRLGGLASNPELAWWRSANM
jgi:hypothetical protein